MSIASKKRTNKTGNKTGLGYTRHFTDTPITWTQRHVTVKDDVGVVVYEADVEAPDFWSDLAVTVAAKTWFRRIDGKMETSIKGMIARVVDGIVEASRYPDTSSDYFRDEAAREAFRADLFHICAQQYALFNTPVWVNVGVSATKHDTAMAFKGRASGEWGIYSTQPPNAGPQASACFIQSVEDTMESLCALQTSETQLFRRGSGTGSNLSGLRPANTPLAGGGTASGPVSFMRALDGWAGVTKSGGSSRRAALMRVLDVYHPDIFSFIETKPTAQKMIRDLGSQGWDVGFNATATTWTPYQNANNSVRVDDAFMLAATSSSAVLGTISLHWPTQWNVKSGSTFVLPPNSVIADVVSASELLGSIAQAAWDCGDPGIQYDTTINAWHTVPNSGRIEASNPCAEYMHLQDSACNLASLKLTKFLTPSGEFDIETFKRVASTMFLAQEILVGAASYPTEKIARNSHDFRPLGLGYCDLGALLMSLGLPYDSEEGRSLCAAITSLLGGIAYATSAQIARDCGGPFAGYSKNRKAMLAVVEKHKQYADELVNVGAASWLNEIPSSPQPCFVSIARAGLSAWNYAYDMGYLHGFRNSQATVLAPTGTIGFALDVDTTGIEPDTALVKIKRLAGGGTLEYVNRTIEPALRRLGYDAEQVRRIAERIKGTGRLPNTDDAWAKLKPEHRPVFATAFGQPGNEISVDGHLKMMAAAQPFLSGAISKTVNCPNNYTVADIRDVFVRAWRLGLKAVAVYRDGCKDQPLSAKGAEEVADTGNVKSECPVANPVCNDHTIGVARDLTGQAVGCTLGVCSTKPTRRRLPADAPAHRHKFSIGGIDGYAHLGFYEDGAIGEIFVRMEPKAGDAQIAIDLATQAASVAIQHGATVESFLDRWEGTRFAPSGFTGEGEAGVAYATSPLDYLAKWLRRRSAQDAQQSPLPASKAPTSQVAPKTPQNASQGPLQQSQGPSCGRCGSTMRRDGACLNCPVCGAGQGGCGG